MEVKNGYVDTEIGAIPSDWALAELGNICDFENGDRGVNYPSPGSFVFSGVPFINAGHVSKGFIDTSSMNYITKESYERLGGGKVKEGDILFCLRGSLGKFGVVPSCFGLGAIASSMIIIRPKKSAVLLGYLMVYFDSSLCAQMIERWAGGAAQPNLGGQDLAKFLLPVPRSEIEQQAIATTLSDVDALIAGLEKLIAKKRDLKQAAMQQLLTGQTRLPGFSGAWVEACLGDLARIQRGASPRPIESPVWFDDTSSVGWVRISDVTSAGMYLTETQQRLSPMGIQHSRPVERGNLIMSICATVGRPVITEIDVCIHDGFVVFDKPQVDKHFLYYVLKWIEPNWSKQGQTGSQMNLNTPLINGTKIMLPPTDEQKAIASALSEMDAGLTAQESRLAKTRDLKQGMMQELLTGRTRLV
jgi:type I restriction enzyme, S subunit